MVFCSWRIASLPPSRKVVETPNLLSYQIEIRLCARDSVNHACMVTVPNGEPSSFESGIIISP
jgi:hypothetical protein